MNCFCTIITSDYLFFAQAIFNSLKKFDEYVNFQVLIVDNGKIEHNDLKTYDLNDIRSNYPVDFIKIKKYEKDRESYLRWALKPLFLKFLLEKHNFSKAIFIDPDVYFYNSPFFLFDELNKSDVLLTPHWRSKSPKLDSENFDSLFSGGLYNAGFFACTKNAINILDWWLESCSYKMIKHGGFYVDQAYLNLLPIYFSKQVKQLEHKGCNVSNWNFVECERSLIDNEVLINKKYPIIFIHFTPGTLKLIQSGKDELLESHLKEYLEALKLNKPDFEFVNHNIKVEIVKTQKSYLKFLKRKLKF